MQRPTRSRFLFTLILLIMGLGIAIGSYPWAKIFFTPTSISAPVAGSASTIETPQAQSGGPIAGRLVIPAIGVNAPIEPAWVLPSGDLDVPTQNRWDGVGWYGDGAYPGQPGTAVIDGHLDRPGGYPAVFWRLHGLQVGNIVEFVDPSGKTLHFRVRAKQAYTPQQAPLAAIFANDTSGTYLNLITCAGQWVPAQGQTSLRLVIYTVLV